MNHCKLIAIGAGENQIPENISKDLIRRQLDRILRHELFVSSVTLQKFLTYVVEETLAGHNDQIKEYTIGVYALKKSKSFEPKNDGVVRVHASRLRILLIKYYQSATIEDEVIVSIPKGSYIPVFQKAGLAVTNAVSALKYVLPSRQTNKAILAVLPFLSVEKNSSRRDFTEHLAQRISTEISKTDHFSILCRHTIRELTRKSIKTHHLKSRFNVKYVFSGDICFEENNVRIFVHLTDASTETECWSDIFTGNFTSYFELSDLVANSITKSFSRFIAEYKERDFTRYPFMHLSRYSRHTQQGF